MNVCLITGSLGLLGSEAVKFYHDKFDRVVGLDCGMRGNFFLTEPSQEPEYINYQGWTTDISNRHLVEITFKDYGADIKYIVHCAAQPSHDLAAKIPFLDFEVNAGGTLNILELARQYCPDATIIHVSTNKVYGDSCNEIPLIRGNTRFYPQIAFADGFDETLSVDQTTHSLFGCSKLYGDLIAQEYARYFGMKVGIFRPGCITGPNHKGAKLHGFLSYLIKCAKYNEPYSVIGYEGKQVRDQIHAYDLVTMFEEFRKDPKPGEVYNVGGGTHSNCSVLEAIEICEKLTGKPMKISFDDNPRKGDHKWWISDISKFRNHYPNWGYRYSLEQIFKEIYDAV